MPAGSVIDDRHACGVGRTVVGGRERVGQLLPGFDRIGRGRLDQRQVGRLDDLRRDRGRVVAQVRIEPLPVTVAVFEMLPVVACIDRDDDTGRGAVASG